MSIDGAEKCPAFAILICVALDDANTEPAINL